MGSDGQDEIVFRGVDGRECEQFIRAVKRHAHAEGKQRDDEWIADFASLCFDGPALRWFSSLEPDTAESWILLRQALLRQYEAEPSRAPLPVPAAASPSAETSAAPLAFRPQTGYIKILAEDPSVGNYVSCKTDEFGTFLSCDDLAGALRVRFVSSARPCGVEILNSPDKLYWLGGAWKTDATASRGYLSTISHPLSKVPLTGAVNRTITECKGAIWSVSPIDGRMEPIWEFDDSTCILNVAIGINSRRVFLVRHFAKHLDGRNHRLYTEAHLEFVPA